MPVAKLQEIVHIAKAVVAGNLSLGRDVSPQTKCYQG